MVRSERVVHHGTEVIPVSVVVSARGGRTGWVWSFPVGVEIAAGLGPFGRLRPIVDVTGLSVALITVCMSRAVMAVQRRSRQRCAGGTERS